MKKMFSFLFIILLAVSAYSQENVEIPSEISMALKSGDAALLSNYLNDNVEMVILDKEGIYNKDQAEVILNDFFKKNPPRRFSLLHQGGKTKSKYGIGNLDTADQTFRVYFLLKETNGKQIIHQLRIEKENG
ncbi:MAG: DUF4783 domain-containing protein [Bacteroidales bacterium]|nr:DUF4783 domain-containing protein [Bacteroidales bacterium]